MIFLVCKYFEDALDLLAAKGSFTFVGKLVGYGDLHDI